MRRVLLVLSVIALVWGGLVIATGGVEWRIAGILFRSRAPDRALIVGLALLVLQAVLFRDAFSRDVARVGALVRPLLPALALVVAMAFALHAAYFGSFAAGGSDSYGYVSQAYSWADGTLPRPQPFPLSLPWPSGDLSLAPLGYRPGPQPHTMVPTYSPGFPLLMAAFLVFGACGPYLVVPACAALVIWLAFAMGRRVDGPWTGILAALFVATSPVVAFQAIVPMSDVPAAALWTGAAYAALGDRRRDALACGAWVAAGLLVRPNLLLIPAVLFAFLLATSSGRERWIRAAAFAGTSMIGVAAIAALNTVMYGAPWNSSYGSTAPMFLVSNILPNLSRYPAWLWRSHSPLVLFALLPLVPPFIRSVNRRAVTLFIGLLVATLTSYLLYGQFEEWWYLRFLLPALPAFFVLQAMGLVAFGRRLPGAWGRVAVTVFAILIVLLTTRFTNAVAPPGPLGLGERRYPDVGLFISQTLPPNAVVLTVQESGSIRHYGGRLTIRWDQIDRDWAPRAAAELERMGLHPYLVTEDFELPQFRRSFGLAADAPLPGQLVARMRQNGGVSIHDLSSRASAGPPVSLEPGQAPRCFGRQPMVLQKP